MENAERIDDTVREIVRGHDVIGSYLWEREHFRKRGERDLEAERELMLVLLEDAVGSFQKYVRARDEKGRILFKEVEEWILEENSDSLYSFENACEIRGLNPNYVRKGLIRWKEIALSKKVHY